jgi:hypothetical protein
MCGWGLCGDHRMLEEVRRRGPPGERFPRVSDSGLLSAGEHRGAILAERRQVDQRPGLFSGLVVQACAYRHRHGARTGSAPYSPGVRVSRLHCGSNSDRIYRRRTTPFEEKQVGHSGGTMCLLMLTLGATLLVAVPAPCSPWIRPSQRPKCSRTS